MRYAGIVRLRQQPETVSGVTFLTLEDEEGMVNAVVWRHVAERQRHILVESQLRGIDGRWERLDGVQHLIVERMECTDSLLQGMEAASSG